MARGDLGRLDELRGIPTDSSSVVGRAVPSASAAEPDGEIPLRGAEERRRVESVFTHETLVVAGDDGSLRFVVFGEAKPGGSKKAFVHPVSGRAIVTEDSKNKPWRAAVAQAGAEAMVLAGREQLFDVPLVVGFTFYKPRPASHYGSGRNSRVLKPSAPVAPATRPDVLKLGRAAEDALTGIVWTDDARIVKEELVKAYGVPARLEVLVRGLRRHPVPPSRPGEAFPGELF